MMIVKNKVVDWVKKQITALSIAFSNVEKNVFSQKSEELVNGFEKQQRNTQGMLADSLLHGEITQEVKNLRWRTYKILKKSKGISILKNNIDEHGNVYYETKKINDKKILKNIKLDNYDNYPLEMVINNDEITLSRNEIIEQVNTFLADNDDNKKIKSQEFFTINKGDKPINIIRNFYTRFNIENYTKKINVRTISDDKKLLEFYISKYDNEYNKTNNLFIKEVKKLFNNKKVNFIEIEEINFISNNTIGSDDFLYYEYKIDSFDKVIEFDGYYVIKFIVDVIKNGEDILSDYIEVELEKKYKTKEPKK